MISLAHWIRNSNLLIWKKLKKKTKKFKWCVGKRNKVGEVQWDFPGKNAQIKEQTRYAIPRFSAYFLFLIDWSMEKFIDDYYEVMPSCLFFQPGLDVSQKYCYGSWFIRQEWIMQVKDFWMKWNPLLENVPFCAMRPPKSNRCNQITNIIEIASFRNNFILWLSIPLLSHIDP